MEVLSKAAGREHLVLSEVQVNSKHGTYRSHRWVNPTEAMDSIKKELKAKGDIEFVGKDGKAYSEKQIVEKHSKEAPNKTIQQYVKENYRIRRATYETMGDLQTRKPLTKKEVKNTKVETVNDQEIRVAVLKGEDDPKNEVVNRAKEIRGQYINLLSNLNKEFDKNKDKMKSKDRLQASSIIQFVGDIIQRQNNPEYWNGMGKLTDEGIDIQKMNDLLIIFPDSDEKIEPFDTDTLRGSWDLGKIKIAESNGKVLKENYRLKATNDYKEVKSGEEFINAAKNLDKLPVDRFARAMLDSTNIKADLIMASYLPGALGAVSSSGDKNKYVALLDTEEYTERARKKTAVHENMHALLTKLIKRSTKEHTETFEEPIVEMAALYSQRELANSNSYVTTPSYADRIAHMVPVLVDMPEFRKCNNVTDLGKVLLNGVLKKDKKLLNKIDNSVVRYDKGRETAIKNFESYLPKDKASRDKFLDKHKDITVKDRNNTLNKKDKDFEVGMSSLISALKSGSLNVEQAFNDPGKKSLMYVLLLSFMEEEGLDELIEAIPF